MVRNFSFQERVAFSMGSRQKTDLDTIQAMIPGCVSVRKTDLEQDKTGVDYVATLKSRVELFIDAKARDKGCARYWKNGMPELALEKWSVVPNDRYGVVGWTLDERKLTDLVLFTFDPSDTPRCYLLPFHHLRAAFIRFESEWVGKFKYRVALQQTNTLYQSECVFVPIRDVLRAICLVSVGDSIQYKETTQLAAPKIGY